MNPRLVVLAGLPETETIHLPLENDEAFVIGRGTECNLALGNVSVSRKHCRITRVEESFKLEDLDSHNGTFVNNSPVKTRLLAHGDRISMGNSYVMFLIREDDDAPDLGAEFADTVLTTNSTIRLFPHNKTADFSPDLNVLVKFGEALTELEDINSLACEFLKIILEFIPARRGAIILSDEELSDPQVVCILAKDSSDTAPMRISRTVCRQVLAEQASLLSNDLSGSHLNLAESLIATNVSSLLCVPLKIGEKKGLIYLDSTDAGFNFTENHLRQMTALSFLISAALANAESIEGLRRENELLKETLDIETDLIGESQKIRDILLLISKAAPTDSTVLISGETGTGKELTAKAIHQNSRRRAHPFVALNCAVLNENLLESELFGHEKGAFTGAITQKKGKLEIADGGTVFLDEVAELSPIVQAKLLRVLENRQFERVGGTKSIKTNVRLITATNRNLEEETKKGAFRPDLFFRLNVVKIKLPPLRERRSDIPLLSQHFVKKHGGKANRKVAGLSAKAREILMNHDWQGNVRELENAIERAIVLGSTDTVLPEDLPEEIIAGKISAPEDAAHFHQQVKNAKRAIVVDALEKVNWNYTEAARLLGIHANNLHRLIKTLGIKDSAEE